MNTDYKIPAPKVVYPRKESLKKQSYFPWLKISAVSAAASVILFIAMPKESQPQQTGINLQSAVVISDTTTAIINIMPDSITENIATYDNKVAKTQIIESEAESNSTPKIKESSKEIPMQQYALHSSPSVTHSKEAIVALVDIEFIGTPIIIGSSEILNEDFLDDDYNSPLKQIINSDRKRTSALKETLSNIPRMLADLGQSISAPFRKTNNNNKVINNEN